MLVFGAFRLILISRRRGPRREMPAGAVAARVWRGFAAHEGGPGYAP